MPCCDVALIVFPSHRASHENLPPATCQEATLELADLIKIKIG